MDQNEICPASLGGEDRAASSGQLHRDDTAPAGSFNAQPKLLPSPRDLALCQYYSCAGWSPELSRYLAETGIDLRLVLAHAGTISVLLGQITGERSGVATFDFSEEGAPCVVIEALSEGGVRPVDLVGWPIDQPERFAVAAGAADILGLAAIYNPATFFGGRPLKLWRTPEGWLRSGCDGAVILNPWGAVELLSQMPGPILAEDLAHGRELRRLLGKAGPSILVPRACGVAA